MKNVREVPGLFIQAKLVTKAISSDSAVSIRLRKRKEKTGRSTISSAATSAGCHSKRAIPRNYKRHRPEIPNILTAMQIRCIRDRILDYCCL